MFGKPEPDEYHEYFRGYVDEAGDVEMLPALQAQETELADAFARVPSDGENYRYTAGKWSLRELLGHLVDAERVFGYRAYCISRGERQPLPGFDEDAYLARAPYARVSLAELVVEFRLLRDANVVLLSRIGPEERTWLTRGIANGTEVSLRAQAWILLGHAAHHLRVLRERYGVS